MACTNLFGWPGYRWGRGPAWTTTGVIRPGTKIQRSIAVAVNDLTGEWAHQLLVDETLSDQPAGRAVGLVTTVVDLTRWEPAIHHREHTATAGGLVGQLRPDRAHGGIGNGPREATPVPAPFF